MDVVRSKPKCPVPVLMYRTYRSVRYRCGCLTELIEVSGTGNTGGMTRYVPYRTHPSWYAVQNVPVGLLTEKKTLKKNADSLNLKEDEKNEFLRLILVCESNSELLILVRSQKQISFVCAN